MEITKSELLEIAQINGIQALKQYVWQGIIDEAKYQEILEELEG